MYSSITIITILVLAMIAFIWGRRRYEVIALCALFLATAAGLVPFSQVFLGFAEPAVITVICVMIISKAISRTGVIEQSMRAVLKPEHHFIWHLMGLCFFTLILSAFMNNVGALAIMLPIAMEVAERNKRSPSLVLMPLALCAALGGLTTLIGTPPNILISQFRAETLGQEFGFFAFGKVGLPVAIVGFLFMCLLGWRLLPKKRKGSHSELALAIEGYITEIRLSKEEEQPLKNVSELENKLPADAQLLGIVRQGKSKFHLHPKTPLLANDILIVEGTPDALKEVMDLMQASLAGTSNLEKIRTDDIALIEGIVAQRSDFEDRTPASLRLRSRFQMVVLAISRGGKTIRTRIAQTVLQPGDVLLLQGPSETVKQNAATLGLLPLQGRDLSPLSNPKIIWPILLFILAIVLTSLRIAPAQITFAGAIVLMLLFRAIPSKLLYEGVDWPVIILLGAMIPVGKALQTAGGTALITHGIFQIISELPPWALVGLIMLITMTISDFMNNVATAIIMAPIAVSVANNLGVNPDAFLMAVAIGASCAFLTPIGHQNNLLIMGPGGYRFTDYLRVGIPLEIIVIALATPLLLWAWPLQ
jgi:di/tricarboxylate transporter